MNMETAEFIAVFYHGKIAVIFGVIAVGLSFVLAQRRADGAIDAADIIFEMRRVRRKDIVHKHIGNGQRIEYEIPARIVSNGALVQKALRKLSLTALGGGDSEIIKPRFTENAQIIALWAGRQADMGAEFGGGIAVAGDKPRGGAIEGGGNNFINIKPIKASGKKLLIMTRQTGQFGRTEASKGVGNGGELTEHMSGLRLAAAQFSGDCVRRGEHGKLRAGGADEGHRAGQ